MNKLSTNTLKEKLSSVPRGGWIRAAVWGLLYVLFVLRLASGDWASLGWLALLPLVLDAFTTKFIPCRGGVSTRIPSLCCTFCILG